MSQSAAQQTAPTVLAPGQRAMIAAVVALGVILALGVVALIVAVFIRISSGATPSAVEAGPRLDTTLTLAQGADIRQVTLDGNRLVIHAAGPNGGQIVVYDLRTGRAVARIKVQ